MVTVVVKLPSKARVLLLEDSEMRITWFAKRVPNLKVCRSVQEFKDYFATKPMVDFIFFDHDLGEGGTGRDAADFLTKGEANGCRMGLIHSFNKKGAESIQQLYPAVPHVPFGDFEVEISD